MDLSRFRQTFFDECREWLESMEQGLLAMDAGDRDPELVHTVFRAAHSIKGGAATFGFSEIARLTHLAETLLDAVRSGQRTADRDVTSVLLQCVDALRVMLAHERDGEPPLADGGAALVEALQRLLDAPPVPTSGESGDSGAAERSAEPPSGGWQIEFRPKPQLFLSGNDPLRILRELHALGSATVEVIDDGLPPFREMDPEQAFLGWRITLQGDVPRDAIDEVFAWVEDECDLRIEPLSGARAEAQAAGPGETPDSAAGAAPAAAPAGNAPSVAAPAAPSGGPSERARSQPAPARTGGSIRVATEKVDALINLVGELVITQSMLRQSATGLDPAEHQRLLAGLEALERHTRDLQDAVLSVRMLPVQFAFQRFPRTVRDLSERLGKRVRLVTSGEGTELDKGLIEHIVDPLNHVLRNAIDHGIEPPEVREAAGKDPVGTIRLDAMHEGGQIVIRVRDDGRGLDRERILAKARERGLAVDDQAPDEQVWELICQPGFSTAGTVTDVSGRGVGMDVVRRNIAALGGTLEIASQAGQGTTITIRLPLTLAITDAMLVRVGAETFVIPLAAVCESLQIDAAAIRPVAGHGRLLELRGDYLPLVPLRDCFGVPGPASEHALAVIVEAGGSRVALEVDELLGQQQVVIKSLEEHCRKVHGISGATILGDGSVALIVDVPALVQRRRLRLVRPAA